jgi:hypothetical protein
MAGIIVSPQSQQVDKLTNGHNADEGHHGDEDQNEGLPFLSVPFLFFSFNFNQGFQISVKLPHDPYKIQVMVCAIVPNGYSFHGTNSF